MSITIAIRSEQFGDTQLTSDHFNTNISYASFTVDSSLGNASSAVANADDLSALSSSLTSDLQALVATLGAGVDPSDYSLGNITLASNAQAPNNSSHSTWTEIIEALDGAIKLNEDIIGNDTLTTTAQTLTGAIEELHAEINSNDGDIAQLFSDLGAEAAARVLGDSNLQTELDATQNSLGFTDTAYSNAGTYIAGVSVTADIGLLDTNLKNLTDSISTDLSTLEQNVEARLGIADISDAQAFVDANSTYLQQAASVLDALTKLDAGLDAEVSRATAAETVLQSNIDAEALARANADANLQSNIDAEEAARIAGDTQLGNQLASLEAELTVTQSNIGTDANGIYTSNAANTHATTDNIKTDIDELDKGIVQNAQAITNLGNAFNYVGLVAGGANSASATDLTALAETDAGDYYKVSSSGEFTADGGATTFYANQNDGLVFNTNGGVDKIDNTNSEVSEAGGNVGVTVSGSSDTGFVIDSSVVDGQISQLNADLTTETNARIAADGALQANIDAETAARIAADNNLQTQITDNDNDIAQLQNDLLAESNARQTEDQNLQNAINAEATARANADAGLQAQITSNDNDISGLDTELTATQLSVGVNADGTLPVYANTNNFQTGDSHHVAIEKLDKALQVSQTVSPSRLTVAPMTHQYASYDRLADPNDLQAYSSSKFGAVGSSAVPYSGHGVGTADLHDYEVAEESVVLGAFVHNGSPAKVHDDNQSHLANFGYWYNVAVFKNGIRLFQRQSNAATLTSSDEYQIKTNDYPVTYPAGNWSADLRYALYIPKYIESTYRYEKFKATVNPDTGANYTYGDLDPVYNANASQIMANLVDNPDQNPVPHPLAGMKNLDNAGNAVHASLAGNPHPQVGEVRYWVVRFGAALDPQDIITVDYMGLR